MNIPQMVQTLQTLVKDCWKHGSTRFVKDWYDYDKWIQISNSRHDRITINYYGEYNDPEPASFIYFDLNDDRVIDIRVLVNDISFSLLDGKIYDYLYAYDVQVSIGSYNSELNIDYHRYLDADYHFNYLLSNNSTEPLPPKDLVYALTPLFDELVLIHNKLIKEFR